MRNLLPFGSPPENIPYNAAIGTLLHTSIKVIRTSQQQVAEWWSCRYPTAAPLPFYSTGSKWDIPHRDLERCYFFLEFLAYDP